MATAPPAAARVRGSRSPRVVLGWLASLVGAAALLWVASHWLDLWPAELVLPRPELLVVALALQLPYALTRALRLRFILDPLVAAATGDPARRFGRLRLYASGLVGFLVLIVVPLRLGELWRPLALAAGQQPGVRVPEGIGAVAVERLVDGLIVVGLLFAGMAAGEVVVDDVELRARVHDFGLGMTAIFGIGLVVLVLVARAPERATAVLGGVIGRFSAAGRARGEALLRRVAFTFAVLLDPRKGAPFVGWSLAYWAITVAQLWAVADACGLAFGIAEAAATIAIVGLSIQLPGGPAQTGNFQVGMALALALFVGGETPAGSSFAALMYLISVVGAAALALPGMVLMVLARRAEAMSTPEESPAVAASAG